MTDTELISAIHTVVRTETKALGENLRRDLKENLRNDLTKEIRTSVKKEVKIAVKEELKETNARLDNIERKQDKMSKKLSYIDRKFIEKVKKIDAKFTGITGEHNIKLDNMQKDIKYLKQQPYYADSRLNFLENRQEITEKRLDILEEKHA